ncbi:MAG: DUF3298 and DUF4163 domain-containing protein [Ruminococcaceae bacterium]|nr:DUF3298 and DUF4163 domain-containing protein [Oscillospiraceae bacterium]
MYADIKYEKAEELLFDDMKPILDLKIVWPILYGNISKKAELNFNSFYLDNAKTANRFARTELYPKARIHYRESQKNGFPFAVNSFIRETKTAYSDCKYLSTVTETYIFTGGAHGISTKFAKTWDLESGTNVSLRTFFRKGFNYRKYMISAILRQIEQINNEDGNKLYPNAEYLAAKNISASGWYISGINEITVFYPEYVIAPHSAGIVEFKVPMLK